MSRWVEVLEPGVLATVQDLGRPGLAALGVGRSGAADASALRLANRLLGNPEEAAALELTLGGFRARVGGGAWVALTGAPAALRVGAREVAPYTVTWVPDGTEVAVGTPPSGLRSYLAVRGGLATPEVLGSRATDVLAGLGRGPLKHGDRLAVGDRAVEPLRVEHAPVLPPTDGELRLRVAAGPRAEWFTPIARQVLLTATFEVSADSDRVGMRLTGPALERSRHEELPSEGMVPGALQVPPSGQPTLFLVDHPVTGGYPVIAVVVAADLDLAAQARPGQRVRFTEVPAPALD